LEVCLDSLGKVVDPQVAGLPSFANRRDSVCADFEDDIMNDHNLASLHYSPETHFVVHGRDGTIFVRRTSDRKIDNPLGPAVLRPNGNGLIVNGGSVECEWPEPQKSQVRGRHPLSPVAACA
jgi:hypothetical protein